MTVLILVLVEDGLGETVNGRKLLYKVLILVLVEDGLGEVSYKDTFHCKFPVLILVLVEDGLGVQDTFLRLRKSLES